MTVHFVLNATSTGRSRRDIELAQSSARSHLAKVFHQRRKARKKIVQYEHCHGSANSDIPHAELCMRETKGEVENLLHHSISLHRPNVWLQMSDELSEPHTFHLLHHCVTVFWPGFSRGSGHDFHTPWNFLAMQGPAVFHSLMWQTSLNLSFLTGVPVTSPQSFVHHQKALACVSQQLNAPLDSIDELMMFTILSLVATEPEKDARNVRKSFDPPYPELGWLTAFGGQPVEQSHTRALFWLVNLKGGIDHLSIQGFATDIFYTDVIQSTQRLCRPQFPVPKVLHRMSASCTRHNLFGYSTRVAIGTEFTPSNMTNSDKLNQAGLTPALADVFMDLQTWVGLLDNNHESHIPEQDTKVWSLQRDLLQHKLLCTIPVDESIDSINNEDFSQRTAIKQPMVLEELFRNALLIFAIGVTFPITYRRPYKVLAQRLSTHLNHELPNLLEIDMHDLVTWVALLGCLAALQAGDLGTYGHLIDILCQTERSVSLRLSCLESVPTCDEFQANPSINIGPRQWSYIASEILSPFLWHQDACGNQGQIVWTDVTARMHQLN